MAVDLQGMPAPTTLVLTPDMVKQFLIANAPIGRSERFQVLDRYEAHWRMLQYKHQQYDWWGRMADEMETISPKSQVPPGYQQMGKLLTRDKRPTAPTHLARTIIKRFTGLLFSNRRIPKLTVEADPDTEAALDAAIKQSKFWASWREARDMGGGIGSVAMTVHLREGRFVIEVHNPKHVTPVWRDRNTYTPLAFLIQYTSLEEEPDLDDKGNVVGMKTVEVLHRRIITEAEDIVYKPVRLGENTVVTWEEDPYLRVRHNLGFFPGIWIQNHRDGDDIDGDPDCQGCWQMLDTMDRLVSQMNKAALNNLDPTAVFTFDPKDVQFNPTGTEMGSDTAKYLGKAGDAKLLEMTGAGIVAALSLYNTLKRSTLDQARCVIPDPEKMTGGPQSGVAKTLDFEPMLECADELREQYGQGVTAVLEIMARMGAAVQGKKVVLPGGRAGQMWLDLPPRLLKDPTTGAIVAVPHTFNSPVNVALSWGPYFAPTDSDDAARIANASNAKQAGLIDKRTGAEHVAGIFGVRDVDAMMKQAEAEEGAELDRALGDGGLGSGFGGGP
jgi:hypothetical protein